MSDVAALPLQVYTGVFFFLLADVFVIAAQFAAVDICKAKPAKSERLRGSALWQQAKKPAVLGLLAAASIAFIFSGEHSMTTARTDAFTEFTAVTLADETVDEQLFADHDLTLINIWATFCGPCLGEMPDLASLHVEYQDRGFQVVGICGDIVDPRTGARYPDLYQKAISLAQQTGADVYTNLDPAGDLMQNYIAPSVAAYPTSVFVNSKGEQVGDMIVGSCSAERWRNEIETRLAMVATDLP